MLKKPAQQSWEVHAEETAVWQVLENRVCSVRLDYPVPLATASVLNGYIHIFKTYLQQQYHKFFLPLWKWYQILQQRPEIFLAWAWFSCFCLACVKCHFVCICGYHLSQGISSYRIQVVLATGGVWCGQSRGKVILYGIVPSTTHLKINYGRGFPSIYLHEFVLIRALLLSCMIVCKWEKTWEQSQHKHALGGFVGVWEWSCGCVRMVMWMCEGVCVGVRVVMCVCEGGCVGVRGWSCRVLV